MHSLTPWRSLLLIALLALAACGNSNTASSPTQAPAATAVPEATTAPAATAVPEAATTAPSGNDSSAGDLQVDSSKLSKQLNIYNWSDYIDPSVLEQFKTEYGVEVVLDVFDSNEDMIAKVRPGNSGYDVIFPSDYAIEIMAKDKLIIPLDKTLLPNMKHIKPANLGLYYDKDNSYSMPYNLGTTGIGYLKSKFPTPPDSWAIMFDPAQAEQTQKNGGFTMLDDERETPGAALRYLGKSLNETDPTILKQVEDVLKAQKPFVGAYDSSSTSRKLSSGEIVAVHIYNNAALQAKLGLTDEYPGNPDVGFFIPKEGGTIWQDNMVILADSPNAYTGHVFINFMMRPDIAAKNAEYLLGISPNAEADKLLPAAIQQAQKEGFAPDAETMKRLEWIQRNDKTSVFTDLWTAVKGE